MKLFVWDDVLWDCAKGIMFAVAPTVEEARAQLLKECCYLPEYDLAQQPKVYDLTESVARVVWGGG